MQSNLKRGLSCFLAARNAISLDYCVEAVVNSLLPVADEVIVSLADDDDGVTPEFFNDWASREKRIRVVNWPWTDPVGKPWILLDWFNWIRENHVCYDMQLSTGADEVLCPKGYAAIQDCVEKKECRWFRKLHFWRDHRHMAPDGTVAGKFIARLGPSELWTTDDEHHPEGEPEMRVRATHDERLRFFHYGFLRRQEEFLKKSRVVQRMIHNSYDLRLVEAEETGKSWFDTSPFIRDGVEMPLVPYNENDHPEVIKPWLREHGFDV